MFWGRVHTEAHIYTSIVLLALKGRSFCLLGKVLELGFSKEGPYEDFGPTVTYNITIYNIIL
jgi:hypothetical protein